MSYIDDIIASKRNIISEATEVELTPELVDEFSNAILECAMNALYNNSDETYVMVSEGANIEMTKAFKNRMKEIIKHLENCKRITNKGDLVAAKEELKKALDTINALESDIKSTDFTVGSAIFGYFVASFISRIQTIIPSIILKITTKGYNNAVNNNMDDFINGSADAMADAMGDIDFDNDEIQFGEFITKILKGYKDAASGHGNPEIKKASAKLKVARIFSSAVNFVKNIRGMYSVYKRYKAGDTSKEALNLYRNKMFMICNDLKKLFDSIIKSYDKNIELANSKKSE